MNIKGITIVIIAIFISWAQDVSAQGNSGVTGTVKDKNNNPLVGAMLYWDGTGLGTVTDAEGRFELNKVIGHNKLITSFLGFETDTLAVDNKSKELDIVLVESDMTVSDIIVQGDQKGTLIKMDGIIKTETITFSGLCKMACCSLAESFENSAAVTVGYSDAISGARQIKMLGLAGTYTQMLDESRPIMRGLGAPYALSYTPGMWLNSIEVSKGITSVAAGSEAITGQINLSHRKPTDSERLFINGYTNQELRAELNVTSALPVIENKLYTVILTHVSADNEANAMDHNNDGFRDSPDKKQINLANRWVYSCSNGMNLALGYKVLQENLLGGMMDYKASMRDDMLEKNIYGSEIENQSANIFFKIAKPVGRSVWDEENGDEIRSNIAIVLDYDHFNEDAYFGLNDYFGAQNTVSANFLYQHYYSTKLSAKMGVVLNSQSINEKLHNDVATMNRDLEYILDRDENTLGAYAEYTYKMDEKLSLVAGLRGDYNDYYAKAYLTPRGQLRWGITPNTALRASVGMGYRSTNVISDNIGILATGRQLIIPEYNDNFDRMEVALTSGASITQKFSVVKSNDITLSLDYFRTDFYNQVYADQEYSDNSIYVYSTTGKSFTDTYQADLIWTPNRSIELLATYRYTNAKMTVNRPDGTTQLVERPLVGRYKGVLNFQYKTNLDIWSFDATAQINGPSRVPSVTGDLADSWMSEPYPMFYLQVTRKLGLVEIYAGCENIANYTQENPILGNTTPFTTDFNSSLIYAPLMGRKFYIGFRFNMY